MEDVKNMDGLAEYPEVDKALKEEVDKSTKMGKEYPMKGKDYPMEGIKKNLEVD